MNDKEALSGAPKIKTWQERRQSGTTVEMYCDQSVVMQNEIDALRAALAAAPDKVGAEDGLRHVGYMNTKYETFFRLSELAATERTTEMLLSGEIIEIFAALPPLQPENAVVVDCYTLASNRNIKIQRTHQISREFLWKVVNGGNCLSRAGEWEYEPIPSSRDDDFLARCRFDSEESAIRAAIASQKENGG